MSDRHADVPAGAPSPRRMTAPKAFNPVVRALLRSPAHRAMSGTLMLLTVVGRKSGLRRTFPVGYLEEPDGWYVLVGEFERKTWWRNLEGGVPVTVEVRGRTVQAIAEVLRQGSAGDTFEEVLGRYLVRFPRTAKVLGVPISDGVADPVALRDVGRRVLLVHVHRTSAVA